jgi:hypothetical protein
MKRISAIIMAGASAALMILGCVSNQAPTTAAPKVGKPLVKRLPANIEGVELVGGTVRVKSGFKWVKQPNGTVIVARMAGGGGGGPGIGGSWSCDCSSAGTCSVVINGGSIICYAGTKDTCKGSCQLTTTTSGVTTSIMLW